MEFTCVFSKNQERFFGADLAAALFGCAKEPAATVGLLSDENFTVNSILIDAWASLKSLRPKVTPPPSGGGGHNPEEDIRMKTAGNLRKTPHRGEERAGWMFTFMAAAYNMVSIRNSGNSVISPATGNRRSKRPRFICEFARHRGIEVFPKQETQLHYVGFSSF